MTSSVLGKRTRSSGKSDPPLLLRKHVHPGPVANAPLSRVKRRLRTDIYDEENEIPNDSRGSQENERNGDTMDLDELSEAVLIRPSRVKHLLTERGAPQFGSKGRWIATLNANNNDENVEPHQIPTPQTPRHRDALSKKIPITPRHRVTVGGKLWTPRTPGTPSTPSASLSTIYSTARRLFTRSTEPGRLVGREGEREELTTFVQQRITKTSGGCIYVSGPPGTGKSAMVNEVTTSLGTSTSLKTAYINCMSMKTSKDVYGNLLDMLGGEVEILEGDELKALQAMFVPRRKTKNVYIITLDEIDHVLTLDLEILYALFEWSLQKSSHLILIGIANALDLTDRFLPRLKARNLKPQLLPFLPYSAAQIKAIITTRLKSLIPADSSTPDYIPFLHPAAIELCSRKVSSQSGDLRKAFDICRRALDLIESETKSKHEEALKETLLQSSPSKKPLAKNVNLSSPSCSSPSKAVTSKSVAESLAKLTAQTAARASIAHLNKITSATFGNGATQRLKTLNLQQKAALCALVALEKRKRLAAANVMATPSKSNRAAPTIKALYETYGMLCRRDSILHPLTSTEFRDVIGSLETLSLISPVDGRNGSFVGLTPSKRGRKGGFGSGVGVGDEKRVGSCVGEKEVAQAVEGLGGGILRSILSGEGLD